ncbi:MAG: diacylglycerol kinase (ATP) [Saprospiraceae bacterium]|jgi:diacylglycerol kinase (ATP)
MLQKRIDSFSFAFKGIFDLLKTQANARIHLCAALFVLISGWYFQITTTEWCLCIFAISAVLAAEAFNTALEYLTDLVSLDYHILAGKTKDVAAAGVLITAIGAAIVGLIIFLPKFLLILT